MTQIEHRRVRAKKRYLCDWCLSLIDKKEAYTYNRYVDGGNFHSWRECDKCKSLVEKMFDKEDYYDPWGDGCNHETFVSFLRDEYGVSSIDEYINTATLYRKEDRA